MFDKIIYKLNPGIEQIKGKSLEYEISKIRLVKDDLLKKIVFKMYL